MIKRVMRILKLQWGPEDDSAVALWAINVMLAGAIPLVLDPCAPTSLMGVQDAAYELMMDYPKDVAVEQVHSMNSVNWPGVWPR